jgi:hypothetical protein
MGKIHSRPGGDTAISNIDEQRTHRFGAKIQSKGEKRHAGILNLRFAICNRAGATIRGLHDG